MSKGLTGIEETARGFVGKVVRYSKTQQGKPKLIFDIACGEPDEDNGKYATWRHCFMYGELAVSMHDIKTGDLVKVSGWVRTEAMFNEYNQITLDRDGFPVKIEKLICFKGEKQSYEKRPRDEQLEMSIARV